MLRLFKANQRLNTAISATFAVALVVFGAYAVAHPTPAQALGNDDRERADLAISAYMDPATLAALPSNHALVNVTVKGTSGTGGPNTVATGRTYTVQEGDTLSGIADRYDMSSGSLILANVELKGNDLIHIGQILTIPDQAASDDALAALKAKAQTLAAVPKKTTATKFSADSSYSLPVRYSYESQGFSGSHPGRDMVAPYGSPIHATKSGCIISSGGGWNGGYGNLVIEDLGGGISARYAHLSAFESGVSAGVCVSQGDVIGYLGSTGNSTGPHLHFELRRNGVAFDPNM